MNKSSFKSRNSTGNMNMQRSNIGTVGMMRQQHSQQNNNMQQQSNMNQQHTNNIQQQMNQQQYNQQQQYYQQQQLAQHHHQQQQQYNSQQPRGSGVGMQHPGSVGMQHPHQQQQMGGQGGGMQQQQMNNGQQQNVVQQLNQKNHRLAKELSDLRVRHREETKVVSRLTMENMNLASRCREAISQVAALKKEVLVYQKKQSEWSTLQKEVMALRKQIDKNTTGSSGSGGSSKKDKELSNSNAGSPGSSLSLNGHHKKQPSGGSSGIGVNTSNNLENNNADRSDSPATDLDRIMSRQFRKTSSDKSGVGSSKLSTKGDKSTAGSKATSPTAATSKSTNKLASANTKIPISVTSSKSKSTTTASTSSAAAAASSQKDDEFDADIDMVDFFAKSQLLNSSSPDATSSSSADTSPSTRLGGRKTYSARKPKSTDDHMPSDVVSPNGSSPKGVGKKKSPVSDNLLSSLDAFEASFASAFPETSFSITSNITTPSASNRPSMDMSFDVPEFDPFFKSPNTSHHTRDSSLNSNSIGSKSSGVNGSTSNKSSSASSPKIQDLFPESAMNFKSSTSPKLDVAFNPATSGANMGFTPIEKKGGGGGGGSSSATKPKKLDAAFSSAKKDSNMPLSPQTMSAEIEQLDAIANLTTSQNENATASSSGGGAATIVAAKTNLRAVRKVKQPVSYAEPSTKSKLRRGDVLFPKVDVSEKNKMSTGGIKSTGSTSPTTDLDRIMGQIATSPPPPDGQ